jgi:circadian clock protein KaiB
VFDLRFSGLVSANSVDDRRGPNQGEIRRTHANKYPAMAVNNYLFRLFIAGDSLRSRQAVANLRRLGEERLAGRYHLTVIDVMTDPESAEASRVLATPTLVKEAPAPPRRVTGDLTDAQQVIVALGLDGDLNFEIG